MKITRGCVGYVFKNNEVGILSICKVYIVFEKCGKFMFFMENSGVFVDNLYILFFYIIILNYFWRNY